MTHRWDVQVIKSLPYDMRSWDPGNRVWNVNQSVLEEAVEKLREAPVHAQVSSPPPVSITSPDLSI